jgi:ribose transport system ATP-binding protein
MAILELRQIKKRFGQTIALDDVNLSLQKGKVHALIGENGAGKSTLMNVISGAFRPDSGAISVKGEPHAPSNPSDARKNGIALIHQELSLAPHLSVAENILMGIENSRFGWVNGKAMEQRASAVLKNFSHPEIRPGLPVSRLSTPAQQVVEICRAIAARAEIILMDEPTSSLQRDDVRHLFSLIRKLKSEGISIIYISHFLEEIREIADSFTVLRDGKSVAAGNIGDVSDEFLVSQMVGRPIDNLFPQRAAYATEGESILEVRDIAAPPILRNASFDLKRGEIFGIAGLMGSGRSEMVRAILGIDDASSGTIAIGGRTVYARGGKPSQRLLQGLGYLSEDRKREGLALTLSIADNITMTRYSACSSFGWLDLRQQRRQSEKLIKELGVRAQAATEPVQTLSGGNQQKVALARLIYQDAEILILDEPTRGIDIGSKTKIYQRITDLADHGKAILMISSYLPELFGMCDRLAVMTRGKLSAARPVTEWTPETVMQAAIGSLEAVEKIDGH